MADASLRFPRSEDDPIVPRTQELYKRLSSERFEEWYRERKWRQNIENGQPYFNGPGQIPDPERHSPSQLLQCHRKMVYRQENAPAESPEPRGIFWFGTHFEEDLLFPFLNNVVAEDDAYIQNSIWINFTTETEAGELRIKGSTDPVIVDSEAVPILPTEIKTKSSVDNIDEPNRHHRAQVHAYLAGLSRKFDKEYRDAVLVYGGRESLGLKTFYVEFDEAFWEKVVLDWAETHTKYRVDSELPPANPEYDWECRFCSYRLRCGKGDTSHSDWDSDGLLPGYDQYPRQSVIEYLEDNPEEALTPALAEKYPDLVDRYGVASWYCPTCENEVDSTKVNADGTPLCPKCADRDKLSDLIFRGGEV